MVSLVTGIGSTLAMNIVAGLHISAGGALVAALPPVAFVLSLETLMGLPGNVYAGRLDLYLHSETMPRLCSCSLANAASRSPRTSATPQP
jgi:hypothetical protein